MKRAISVKGIVKVFNTYQGGMLTSAYFNQPLANPLHPACRLTVKVGA